MTSVQRAGRASADGKALARAARAAARQLARLEEEKKRCRRLGDGFSAQAHFLQNKEGGRSVRRHEIHVCSYWQPSAWRSPEPSHSSRGVHPSLTSVLRFSIPLDDLLPGFGVVHPTATSEVSLSLTGNPFPGRSTSCAIALHMPRATGPVGETTTGGIAEVNRARQNGGGSSLAGPGQQARRTEAKWSSRRPPQSSGSAHPYRLRRAPSALMSSWCL